MFSVNKNIFIAPEDAIDAREFIKEKENLDLANEEIKLLENLLKIEEVAEESDTVVKENVENDTDIEEILRINNIEGEKDTGLINESKEKQGKLRWNLFIFILFLIAVIVWIFWVNRELIKERQAQNKDDDKKENNKSENKKF